MLVKKITTLIYLFIIPNVVILHPFFYFSYYYYYLSYFYQRVLIERRNEIEIIGVGILKNIDNRIGNNKNRNNMDRNNRNRNNRIELGKVPKERQGILLPAQCFKSTFILIQLSLTPCSDRSYPVDRGKGPHNTGKLTT